MRWPVLAAGWLLLLASAACAAVLGLDEERMDAVAALCGCDDVKNLYTGGCKELLSQRLEGATAETRGRWLAFYIEHCAAAEEGTCARPLECYQQPPTCSTGDCVAADECCMGFKCIEGLCRECIPVGEPCNSADECCGPEDGVACVLSACVAP
jgi:hypothetical protein